MKKYIMQWISITLIVGLSLYGIISLITNTRFNNLSGEFEILLMLIGFSTLLATIIICTKIIIDKINR